MLQAALSRAAVGAYADDVELIHRASELCLTFAASRIFVIYT